MRIDERRGIRGGLTKTQIESLPAEVREARRRYIRGTASEMEFTEDSGFTELPYDHPEKDVWWTDRRYDRTVSWDLLSDNGWEFDEEGNVYAQGIRVG